MLTKIKRQACLERYPVFPQWGYDHGADEEPFYFPTVYRSYILTMPARSFEGNIQALGFELTSLARELQTDVLLFLGDTPVPWLYQLSEFKPVKEAQDYLMSRKVGKRFSGALQADLAELPEFIPHLSWLVRCNAALPYIHFIDPAQRIVASICQYGNLHLSTLHAEADERLGAFMAKSRFRYGDKTACYDRFGPPEAVQG